MRRQDERFAPEYKPDKPYYKVLNGEARAEEADEHILGISNFFRMQDAGCRTQDVE